MRRDALGAAAKKQPKGVAGFFKTLKSRSSMAASLTGWPRSERPPGPTWVSAMRSGCPRRTAFLSPSATRAAWYARGTQGVAE
jgi:hypothetical protein